MDVIESLEHLQEWKSQITGSRGFVPTMGALHEGHASLIRRSNQQCEKTLVSIFVNPAQFNDPKDFSGYPSSLDSDLELCRSLGVSAVFLPNEKMIYPRGLKTQIFPFDPEEPDRVLCDKGRPGHFRGVLTVVNILFHLVEPQRAYFGLKDAQQCAYIENMVMDLRMPVDIVLCPTIRESDGLALSSRNAKLTPQDRQRAAIIPFILSKLAKAELRLEEGRTALRDAGIEVEYLEYRDFPNLSLLEDPFRLRGKARLFFAATLGAVRLIDNWEVEVE